MIYQLWHLEPGQKLYKDGILLAEKPGAEITEVESSTAASLIKRPYDLFLLAGSELERDFAIIAANRVSVRLHNHNTVIGAHPVFLEDGATVNCSILNTENGAIYIGKNAHVMEGCVIHGPFAMGEGSVLKIGTKAYNKTALGPYTVIGGEVNNIQVQGYSNKGHDGFLGNSVIGEWCNIGADSNSSNLKNNYEEVKVWNYTSGRFDKSGQQFCGLIMGDHSKCGINTMFNTGTVVGVSANVFGPGFPRQFIPDFAWGGASGFTTYKLDAASKTASLVMPRRKKEFDETEQAILAEVFEMTKDWRNWE
jgi:UDP-N-acetylglucosamine diphosphorylase/glucosamine-1-phosphate N-acetyltransferase